MNSVFQRTADIHAFRGTLAHHPPRSLCVFRRLDPRSSRTSTVQGQNPTNTALDILRLLRIIS